MNLKYSCMTFFVNQNEIQTKRRGKKIIRPLEYLPKYMRLAECAVATGLGFNSHEMRAVGLGSQNMFAPQIKLSVPLPEQNMICSDIYI